jgi:hypothetical protein
VAALLFWQYSRPSQSHLLPIVAAHHRPVSCACSFPHPTPLSNLPASLPSLPSSSSILALSPYTIDPDSIDPAPPVPTPLLGLALRYPPVSVAFRHLRLNPPRSQPSPPIPGSTNTYTTTTTTPLLTAPHLPLIQPRLLYLHSLIIFAQ